MTRITDERLEELKEGWAHQASLVHDCSLAGSQYQSTCEDTASALRELQQCRLLLREHWESDCEVAGCEMCVAGSAVACPAST